MSAMRVIFLTQWFAPEPGNIRGLPLARWLIGRGYDVQVLTGVPNYPTGRIYPGYRLRLWQREVVDDVSILRVPLYPSHDASSVRRVANYASFALAAATVGAGLIGRADVVYAYHPPATIGLPATVLKALRRIPFIFHVADLWPEAVVDSGMLQGGAFVRRGVEGGITAWCRFLYRLADAVTVISPGFRRRLIARGVEAEKIHVIYNWADEAAFQPRNPEADLAGKLGLAGRFNIVFAGNLGAFQGLEAVIRAAAQVKHVQAIQVVLAGSGQKEADLRQLADRLCCTNVLFLGGRDHLEMSKICSLADVLLVHLRDLPFLATTIPGKTQAALACGRPILMGARGDAADLVTRAGAGITCAPEDDAAIAEAMVTLSRMSKDQLEQMGARGRKFYVDEMSLNVAGDQMDCLFKAIAGGKKPRSDRDNR
jgi:glycosyltransferase involved in cell wall biosynthesis